MRCVACGSSAVSEGSDPPVQGYRRFHRSTCGKQFNERSAGLLNRTQYPSDVIALVVLWRLRYKLALAAEVPQSRAIDMTTLITDLHGKPIPDSPLCHRSCRPDRIGTFGGAGRRTWLDTDSDIRIG